MDEKEFEEWCRDVDKAFYSEIILDRLVKNGKINNKQKKAIKQRIKKLTYKTLLKSPHLENNEALKNKALLFCIQDYFPSKKLLQSRGSE